MLSLSKFKSDSGQTLLVVVLTISVSLIVVMSVVARSITDVKVTDQESDSLRAFSAAEAGVERALIAGSQSTTSLDNGTSQYTAPVNLYAQGSTYFTSPTTILSGESLTVWFMSHNADGSLKQTCGAGDCYPGTQMNICWWEGTVNPPAGETPAIEVTMYYATNVANAVTPVDLSTIQVKRMAYDPITRSPANNFGAVDAGSCDWGTTSFKYQKAIVLPAGTPILAKIRTLYNTTTPVKFGLQSSNANWTFPSQGLAVNSTGVSGDANRKISVFQGYDDTPEVFDSGLFSLGGVEQ